MTIEQELSAVMQTLNEREAETLFEGRSVPSDAAAEQRIADAVMARVKAETADQNAVKKRRRMKMLTRVMLASAACLVLGVSAVLFRQQKPQITNAPADNHSLKSDESPSVEQNGAAPAVSGADRSQEQSKKAEENPAVTTSATETGAYAGGETSVTTAQTVTEPAVTETKQSQSVTETRTTVSTVQTTVTTRTTAAEIVQTKSETRPTEPQKTEPATQPQEDPPQEDQPTEGGVEDGGSASKGGTEQGGIDPPESGDPPAVVTTMVGANEMPADVEDTTTTTETTEY